MALPILKGASAHYTDLSRLTDFGDASSSGGPPSRRTFYSDFSMQRGCRLGKLRSHSVSVVAAAVSQISAEDGKPKQQTDAKPRFHRRAKTSDNGILRAFSAGSARKGPAHSKRERVVTRNEFRSRSLLAKTPTYESEDGIDHTQFSSVLGGFVSSEPTDADTSTSSAASSQPVGNPLGKRVLGQAAVSWLSQGLGRMAEDLVEHAVWVADIEKEGFSLLSIARQYLQKAEMPAGAEDKCRQGMEHLPTVWDHLQREVQGVLKKRGFEGDWKANTAWKVMKLLGKTAEHKALTRKPTPAFSEPSSAPLRLSSDQQAVVASAVSIYTQHAQMLLEAERQAEISATRRALDGASPPAEEEDRENSLRKLLAVRSSSGLGGVHLVTLRPSKSGGAKLPPSAITPGDLVFIRPEFGGSPTWGEDLRGTVQALGEDGATIVVALEKKMGDPATAKLFGRVLRVDRVLALADAVTYERNLQALAALKRAGSSGRTSARKIITSLFAEGLDIIPSAFESTTSEEPSTKASSISTSEGSLDFSQSSAVEHAFNSKAPVAVIQGPPGTGKSVTLVDIINKAVQRGLKVLATAPTNAAVDNLVDRLSQRGVNLIRVGNPARMAPAVVSRSLSVQVDAELADWRRDMARRRADLRADLRACSSDAEMAAGLRIMLKKLSKLLKQTEKATVERLLGEASVVLCTNTGAGDPLVRKQGPFDLVLVDEAGQATEPSTWIPLLQGKRAVLAGDACQLAPLVVSRTALDGGLDISLLERAAKLYQGYLLRMLQVQYRMHSAISDWASKEMYNGLLTPAPTVANRLLKDLPGVLTTPDTTTPMLLLDTRRPRGSLLPGCEEQLDPSGSGSLFNVGEADLVKAHVSALMSAGVPPSEIAVQSPYLAQVELLRQKLEDLGEAAAEVEVASVDSFQGREAHAVIISLVRSNNAGTIGFLGDSRRMNVAITRARMHVAVVCDSTTVASNPFLLRLLVHIRQRGEVRSANLLGTGGDLVLQPSSVREKALIGQTK